MTKTVYYQGWRYTTDPTAPYRERWIATKGDSVIKTQTEAGVQRLIDTHNEHVSQGAMA